ncbi:hypothetical protein SAMN05920897_10271 [Alkalispirochaeta americana]|uniref:Tetratricopeptide repeat-containing protein n=1 Tax=Alkalispirochaeta americana TaxID=159291 RepID=A0A1N6P0J1_9SPIO|nr:hypothetical protein [Alkalispirochaeta americana]SIP97918.1 hypothetical protein SAMN05920897_10271 [Alkalispirochaeta americana]
MKKLILRRLPAVLLLLLISVSLPASGRREDPVRRARGLVAENRINDAILLLEQTIRDDPERIVEAEALMRAIRGIRGEYNVLFELLIQNLIDNPDDIARTLDIIDRMEQLDEFPNARVLQQVEDARVIAQLAYDRNLVDQAMSEARELFQAGRHAEAARIYLSLGDLQRDRFEGRGYSDIFVNQVDRALVRLDEAGGNFLGLIDVYTQVSLPLTAAASEGPVPLEADFFAEYLAQGQELHGVLERARSLSQDVLVLRSQVALQFPDDPVDWYLNFQDIFLRGRPDLRNQEGLVAVMTEFYDAPLVEASRMSREQALEAYGEGNDFLGRDELPQAIEAYQLAAEAALAWERLEEVRIGLFEPDQPAREIIADRPSREAGPPLTARFRKESARYLADLAGTLQNLPVIREDDRALAELLRSRKEEIQEVVDRLTGQEEAWKNRVETIGQFPEDYLAQMDHSPLEEVLDEAARRLEGMVSKTQRLAVEVSLLETAEVPLVIARSRDVLAETSLLLEGVEEPLEEDLPDEAPGEAVRIARYPDEAAQRLEILEGVLARAREEVERAREGLEGDREYVSGSAPVQSELLRLTVLRQDLDDLAAQGGERFEEAEQLIAEARIQESEGFSRIADARAAIAAMQIDAARRNWEAARDAFFDSLELREQDALRTTADQEIAAVGQELLELENVLVVQRVRELLTRAEAQYSQDEYVAARDTLIQAQQTWEQTNIESNSEIDRLLILATAALSLEEGRELSPTDPLYPVLGNYLSLAREDYNRGVLLFRQGRKEDADRLFDRSIENLRNVRDVRPLNWDARILELRIVQLRDADEFEDIFATRYNQALARLDQAGPLEVYSELEVLAEINPNYPGLQTQLRRLEIALNLRPDPADQQRIARARQLYGEAQRLARGSRDQVVVAVSLLEDAVNLHPDNRDVRFLLDELRIRLGGRATAALSTADEQQYRRAETLFQQGQVVQALAITERLLSNPENQGYPPLVDLRRRIGLRLGI